MGRPANAPNPSRNDDQYAAATAGGTPSESIAAASAAGRLFSAARTMTIEGSNTAVVAVSKSRTSTASAQPATTAGGLIGFVVLVMLSVWLTVRKQAERSANLRLEAGTEEVTFGQRKRSLVVALVLRSAQAPWRGNASMMKNTSQWDSKRSTEIGRRSKAEASSQQPGSAGSPTH